MADACAGCQSIVRGRKADRRSQIAAIGYRLLAISFPVSVSIHLFSHVDDAWADDLRAWLEAGTKAALSGQKIWLVCRSVLQANWLRRLAMGERKALVGVGFRDLRRVRPDLCLRTGLPTPSLRRGTLLRFVCPDTQQ